MTMSELLDPAHYMQLPICGYCMNAWDIIFQRQRPGTVSPQRWVEFCRVGGCDPDVWEFIDLETGWPFGFNLTASGRVDWEDVATNYIPPDGDNEVYHRRTTDAITARWRRESTRLLASYCMKRDSRYQAVTDKHGNVISKVVPQEMIQWGDDDEPAEEIQESVTQVAQEDDDDIW